MPSPDSWSGTTDIVPSGSTNIDALLMDARWTDPNISYSFPGYYSSWSTSDSTGYGPWDGFAEPWSDNFDVLTVSDEGYFTAALQKWADVADLHFSQVVDDELTVGDIRAAYTDGAVVGGDAQAWAYGPSDTSYGGDVWFDYWGSSWEEEWTPGSYENLTTMHEIGHAIGLNHPFDGTTTLPTELDTVSFTIMSYSAVPGDPSTIFSFYPTTPMVLDIAAIQYLYGANIGYHAGNNSYAYSDATYYHETIWDGGSTDVIQYGGSLNSSIDLRPGVAYGSEIGLPVYAQTAGGSNLYEVNNVWIADGSVIENATGGSGSDRLTGNSLGNVLSGGGGKDTLDGGAGSDILKGAASIDQLNGGANNDQLLGGAGNDTLTGGTGNDKFVFDTALSANKDRILDFTTGDKIWLDNDIFTALGNQSSTTNLTGAAFFAGANAHDASDRIIYNAVTGALYYDSDGTGAAAKAQFAVFGTGTHPALVFNDFQIIA